MLGSKGFDLWADGYDKSVGLPDKQGTYPFAGYKEIPGEIYSAVFVLSLMHGAGHRSRHRGSVLKAL